MTGAEALINQGIEQGIEQGIQQGELRILLRQIDTKFGAVSEAIRSRIGRLSETQIEELTTAILNLPDLSALEVWLNEQETTD